MISKHLVNKLSELLANFPDKWDGRAAISELKESGNRNWRQMEWAGWYFQHLCETRLAKILEIPGTKFGRASFDGFAEIPWDFKAHSEKDHEGRIDHKVLVNDKLAIENAIKQHGGVGLILAIGKVERDNARREFQLWHQKLKGGLSKYEEERILRKARSRLRKKSFRLKGIHLIFLDKNTLQNTSPFQKGFRNSNGNPRNEKVKIDLRFVKPVKIITPNKS